VEEWTRQGPRPRGFPFCRLFLTSLRVVIEDLSAGKGRSSSFSFGGVASDHGTRVLCDIVPAAGKEDFGAVYFDG